MSSEPNRPDDIDTEGKTVPPYEGRRKSAEVDDPAKTRKKGARTGGATGPVQDDEMKAPEPERTEGGATGSPADRRASKGAPQADTEDEGTGPAHHRGTPRGEDQP
jgi:hypothetical protein